MPNEQMRQDGRQNRGYPHGNQRNTGIVSIADEVSAKAEIIIDPAKDAKGNELISCAQKLGQYLAVNVRMTTSQIRNLFAEAVRIKKIYGNDNKGPYEVNLLRAKFAYNAGRFREVKDFQKIADRMLLHIDSKEKFTRFFDFFEAVVAYHKQYGGKE
ncbi:type III-A CRISPR-associated protein Csm2 [Methylomusa anaerophila]|uniref:CRISPR system Cms protein Csm2 n=1 Tax=Methylomusa anaerophila TaxID=1930071 RepID=A0A348AR48_9FIRM|nr:type III-A CRISPR-associated protein Csm2 [Methylomusa anaerophila]BBB93546.1 hypothetical protein MAMMFC1_04264 [Methylomusa anaerophila]